MQRLPKHTQTYRTGLGPKQQRTVYKVYRAVAVPVLISGAMLGHHFCYHYFHYPYYYSAFVVSQKHGVCRFVDYLVFMEA